MAGTVLAPGLSAKPLTVDGGIFQLFVVDPDEVETRNMIYRMTLVSEEGKRWYFDGFKVVHQGPVTSIWHDTSTLYITLRENDANGVVAGLGILHIEPSDFVKQMTTMQVTNAAGPVERLKTLSRFGEFFAGTLFETYGGIFARSTAFNPDAPPRRKRALRVGAPVVYSFPAKDGVPLRLTRYQGGSKGPVILSHGLGVSSLIFSLDTIDTNMLEYLYAHGYDVWLLDYRNSIALRVRRRRCRPPATMWRSTIIRPPWTRSAKSPARATSRWWYTVGAPPRFSWPCWPAFRASARWSARKSPPTW